MNQETEHGPSKVRHLAPILAGVVVLVIVGWVVMNKTSPNVEQTPDASVRVVQLLQGVSAALVETQGVADNINEHHLVPGWRMMESYVINRQESASESPDDPKMYAEHLTLLNEFVNKNVAIASSLASLPKDAVSPEFAAEITQFGAYTNNLTDRLAALPNSVDTGASLPAVVSMPEDFAAKVEAEIARLNAS